MVLELLINMKTGIYAAPAVKGLSKQLLSFPFFSNVCVCWDGIQMPCIYLQRRAKPKGGNYLFYK